MQSQMIVEQLVDAPRELISNMKGYIIEKYFGVMRRVNYL